MVLVLVNYNNPDAFTYKINSLTMFLCIMQNENDWMMKSNISTPKWSLTWTWVCKNNDETNLVEHKRSY